MRILSKVPSLLLQQSRRGRGAGVRRRRLSSPRNFGGLGIDESVVSFNGRRDHSLVNESFAPDDFQSHCAVVYPNFLTPEEGTLIVDDVLNRMKRRRYEKGHWDAVITSYKEVELPDDLLSKENPALLRIFNRARNFLAQEHLTSNATKRNDDDASTAMEQSSIRWLPCHAIDLKREGELNAHVDSVKFSGGLVAGISLMSASIMRLLPNTDTSKRAEQERDQLQTDGPRHDNQECVDMLLPELSMYVLTGVARYEYSHQLLPDRSQFFLKHSSTDRQAYERVEVLRDQRVSVIFRDAK